MPEWHAGRIAVVEEIFKTPPPLPQNRKKKLQGIPSTIERHVRPAISFEPRTSTQL